MVGPIPYFGFDPIDCYINILQLKSYLQEWDPQEHANVSSELRPKGPQGVGLNLLDDLDLVHEVADQDIQSDVVNSFQFLIQSNIFGFGFFLFLKASMINGNVIL